MVNQNLAEKENDVKLNIKLIVFEAMSSVIMQSCAKLDICIIEVAKYRDIYRCHFFFFSLNSDGKACRALIDQRERPTLVEFGPSSVFPF